jgi:dTDP-glucose 4,6-dehydratase
MQSKTLLIIGGSGFFAKSILDYISDCILFKDIKTIFLLSRGINKIKISNKLKKKIEIKKIRADISKLKKIPYADYIIYCAINHSLNYKQDYNAVYNYCKLAKKYHSKSKILYASSGAVYGQQPENIKKIKENYLSSNKKISFKNTSKNFYSTSKLKSEKIFQKLGKSGIKISVARCFAFVGKHLPRNEGFAIGNFIDNIIKNKVIKINSLHDVIRSYMYADDLARWLLQMVFSANNKCPTYNLGSDSEISIFELANFLSKKYNATISSKQIKKSNFVDRYIPSISKAKNKLKLNIEYGNLQAVIKTIELLRNEKTN